MIIKTLNSSISNDDDNLETSGYDLFRAGHPSNTKRVGVLYYRNYLPLEFLSTQYLQGCINFEIRIESSRFVSLYRSLSQLQGDFEAFTNNLELNIDTATTNKNF